MPDRDAAPGTVRTSRAGIVDLIVQACGTFARHDMSTYAAALAYDTLFSLFPFVIFLLALLSFLNLADRFAWIRGHAQLVLPPSAMEQLNLVQSEVQVPKAGLLSAGTALSLWLSSRGVRALMKALNVAYCAAEGSVALFEKGRNRSKQGRRDRYRSRTSPPHQIRVPKSHVTQNALLGRLRSSAPPAVVRMQNRQLANYRDTGGRQCPDVDYEIAFETDEWQAAHL